MDPRCSLDFGPGARLRSGRHYRPGQLLGWGAEQLVRLGERASPLSPHALTLLAPGPRSPDREALAVWGARPEAPRLAPAWRPDRHGDPRLGRWRFQEQEARFDGPVDWLSASRPLLWRYHLHYLDAAAALAAHEPDGDWQPWLTGLLDDHMRRCRPGRGPAWLPFPLATRLQNLLRIHATLEARGGAAPDLDRLLCRATRASFHYLRARLERHLQGNHLLKELCSLCCAARVWAGRRLRRRLLEALERQVGRQFLAGGGHEERSLRYHLDCLRDLAEVRAALGQEAPRWLQAALVRGLDFAEALEHPDGDVPLFNDSELGAACRRSDLDELLGLERSPWRGLRAFVEEGYVAARAGGTHLVFDCGPVGPDHQPAHAHCDVLSLEVSHDGARLLGNRGTLAYGAGPDRLLSRTTASHSTVQFDDVEQVEIHHPFRVGWRGKPVLEQARQVGSELRVSGRYAWHPGVGAEHRRTVVLRPDGSVLIEDVLRPGRAGGAVARYWLPGAAVVEAGADELVFATGGRRHRLRVAGARLEARRSTWFPRLGLTAPAVAVDLRPGPPGGGGELRLSAELIPGPG